MKLNKEKFLKSELGGNLDECVKSWDFAIRGGKRTKPIADWCQAQWEVYQMALKQFYGVCTEDETDWLFKVEREV